jgi:hypothetical protein
VSVELLNQDTVVPYLKDKKVIFIRKKIQQPFLLLKFNLRLVTICVDLFKYG